MKTSTLIRERREIGRWFALPPDHEDDERRPAPDVPPPPWRKACPPGRDGQGDEPTPQSPGSADEAGRTLP